jgi:hypothetical protein
MMRANQLLVRQVLPVRLRPGWRVTIKSPVLLAFLVCSLWAYDALIAALVEHNVKQFDLKELNVTELRILVDRRIGEMQLEMQLELDKARKISMQYDPEFCEWANARDLSLDDCALFMSSVPHPRHKEEEPERRPERRPIAPRALLSDPPPSGVPSSAR